MHRNFELDTKTKDILYLPFRATEQIPLNGNFVDYQAWCEMEVLRINRANPRRKAELIIADGNDHGRGVKKVKVVAYPYRSVNENKKPRKNG